MFGMPGRRRGHVVAVAHDAAGGLHFWHHLSVYLAASSTARKWQPGYVKVMEQGGFLGGRSRMMVGMGRNALCGPNLTPTCAVGVDCCLGFLKRS